jgi:hypothetical protein
VTDEQVIEALRNYELAFGWPPTRDSWDAHRHVPNPSLLCSRAIVRRFGSWNGALRLAGMEPVREARRVR